LGKEGHIYLKEFGHKVAFPETEERKMTKMYRERER